MEDPILVTMNTSDTTLCRGNFSSNTWYILEIPAVAPNPTVREASTESSATVRGTRVLRHQTTEEVEIFLLSQGTIYQSSLL